jgi:Trp operon repressor
MAKTEVHLVRVTTDDEKHQLWVAAASSETAVNLVLNAIPEGWTATLLPDLLAPEEMEQLKMRPGEVREISHRGKSRRTIN